MRSIRRPALAFYGTALLAFFLRLYRIGRAGFWADEISTLQCVAGSWGHLWTALSRSSELGLSNPNTNPPFYFALLWLWCKAFGASEAALRIPSALFGAAAVVVGGRVAARLGGRTSGVWAVLLLALHPTLLIYSREARPYSLGILLAVLLVWLCLDLAEPAPGRRFSKLGGAAAFAALAAALAMTQYHLAVLPAALGGWVAFQRKEWQRPLAWASLPTIALGLWWLPCLADSVFSGNASFYMTGYRLVGRPDPLVMPLRIAMMLAGLAAAEFSVPLTTALYPSWAAVCIAAGACVLTWKYLRGISRLPMLALFLFYAGALFIADAWHPFVSAKYFLFFLPFMLIPVAVELGGEKARWTRLFAAAMILGWIAVDGAVLRKWPKSKEREVARAIDSMSGGRARYLAVSPGFMRDAIFYYLRPRATVAGVPERLAVVDAFLPADAGRSLVLGREPSLRLLSSSIFTPDDGDKSGRFACRVFEMRDPGKTIPSLERDFSPFRMPFDPSLIHERPR